MTGFSDSSRNVKKHKYINYVVYVIVYTFLVKFRLDYILATYVVEHNMPYVHGRH